MPRRSQEAKLRRAIAGCSRFASSLLASFEKHAAAGGKRRSVKWKEKCKAAAERLAGQGEAPRRAAASQLGGELAAQAGAALEQASSAGAQRLAPPEAAAGAGLPAAGALGAGFGWPARPRSQRRGGQRRCRGDLPQARGSASGLAAPRARGSKAARGWPRARGSSSRRSRPPAPQGSRPPAQARGAATRGAREEQP